MSQHLADRRRTAHRGCRLDGIGRAGLALVPVRRILATSQTSPTLDGAAHRRARRRSASAGQAALDPVHDLRHVAVTGRRATDAPIDDGTKSSAGQSSLEPSQTSATSQMPAAARHSAVLLASAGQLSPTPSQDSARSQAPAEARHSAVLLASAGQSLPTPSQLSARSQAPAEARHSAELLASAGQSSPDAVADSPRGRRRPPRRGTDAVLLASAGQ